MRRRLLCRLGRHHWRQQLAEDNEPYVGCQYCTAVQTGPPGSRDGGIPPGAIPSV